ncbi:3-dehydroquinate synthase [Streptococcus phocae subsp. phocae]
MTKTLQIHSRVKDYNILFTDAIFETISTLVARRNGAKPFIITDDNVHHLYQPLFERLKTHFQGYVHVCAPGGHSKSLEEASAIYELLLAENITKNDLIITIGGGVIGDLGGFVAATFYRGIPYIQIPTTLLSQVDSSIGGKVGVHFKGFTNMIGSIYPPEAIIVSTDFLKTLPQREFACGMSEIIKIAFIHDRQLFGALTTYHNHPSTRMLQDIIYQAIANKKNIVEQDEFEGHQRLSLNFGHTLGHAIEALNDHETYLHGEAIAIGMLFDAKLALKQELLPLEDYHALKTLLQAYQLPTQLTTSSKQAEELFEILKTDKKNKGEHIIFILPNQNSFTTFPVLKSDRTFSQTLKDLLNQKG